MRPLTIVSLLADNARPLYRAVARYLSEHANLPAQRVEGVPWQEQEHMMDRGTADLVFLCVLPSCTPHAAMCSKRLLILR